MSQIARNRANMKQNYSKENKLKFHKKPKCTLIIILIVYLFSGCQNNKSFATIYIDDRYENEKPVFRYVVWNGERFSPSTFSAIAKNKKGITKIILSKEGDIQIECSKSIAKNSGFILVLKQTNKIVDTINAKPLEDTCEIPNENKSTILDILKSSKN